MHDACGALRRLWRRPASAAGIVLTLALGIGASVGMFSVLYGVVLKALPYVAQPNQACRQRERRRERNGR